jgi:hypothetical protein
MNENSSHQTLILITLENPRQRTIKSNMKILNIAQDPDASFYCPLSGEKLFGSDLSDHGDSPNLQGIWVNEIITEPSRLKGDMEKVWGSYDPENVDFDEWLEALEIENHFAICVSELSVIQTCAWYVFKTGA